MNEATMASKSASLTHQALLALEQVVRDAPISKSADSSETVRFTVEFLYTMGYGEGDAFEEFIRLVEISPESIVAGRERNAALRKVLDRIYVSVGVVSRYDALKRSG